MSICGRSIVQLCGTYLNPFLNSKNCISLKKLHQGGKKDITMQPTAKHKTTSCVLDT